MGAQPQSAVRLAFGPFEVHTEAGELRKRGIRVRLSGQPFQILLVLLAHPGEVVTREQLREEVWVAGTFVDFEHGLNAAMNKLRGALSDSPENPRYLKPSRAGDIVLSEPWRARTAHGHSTRG